MIQRNGELLYRRLYSLFLPTLASSMTVQVLLFVNSIVVGHMLEPYHLAALGLASPIIQAYSAFLRLFGVGGTVLVAFHKGRREERICSEIFSATLLLMLVACAVFSGLCLIRMDALVAFLCGGNEELAPILTDFLRPYVAGAVTMLLACGLGFFIRMDGHPKLVLGALFAAIVANAVFAPVLVRLTGGLAGIGAAMSLAFVVSLLCYVKYARSSFRSLRLVNPLPRVVGYTRSILGAGMPGFVTLVTGIVRTVFLNALALSIGGAVGMAVYAIVSTVQTLIFMFFGAASQSMMPVLGVLYGERDYVGIRFLFRRCLLVIQFMAFGLFALFLICPGALLALFGINAPADLAQGVPALRILGCAFFAMSFVCLMRAYSQALKRSAFSISLSVLDFIVFLLPAAWFLSRAVGVNGIWLAVFVSEALTTIFILVAAKWRAVRSKGRESGLLMLPEGEACSRAFDVTIRNDLDEAMKLSETLMQFAVRQGMDERQAYRLALAAEEMTVNIIQFGRKSGGADYIDVSLAIGDAHATLSVRDDGPPFNPTLHTNTQEDEPTCHGIDLVRKISERMDYAQTLGFNNTIVVVRRA